MQKLSFLFAFAMIFMSSSAAAATCSTDARYVSAGWVVSNPAKFQALSKELLDRFETEKSEYVYDTEGKFRDSTSGRIYLARSFDRLSTPRPEMYGDFLMITDIKTGKLVELRWYENGKKQLVYDPNFQACATSLFPWARNALF